MGWKKGILTAVEEQEPRLQEREREREAHRGMHKENISPKPFAGKREKERV